MLRNRELRRFAVFLCCMGAAACVAGFAVGTAAGLLVTAVCAAFGTAFFVFTHARYERIARLSDEIDLVLHHAEHLSIAQSDEGELSILQSEITKMTLRIREQNKALLREKELLADSLADIAHQLRTPLTSANLILSLLANAPDEAGQKALLREAEELLVRMDWLITSLLKLSRLDAGIVAFQREPVDVAHLLRTALRPLLIPMELHDITVHTGVPEGAVLQGDPGWLSEAIQNILKNCMESVGDHGSIRIACEDTALYTEITVHDSGAGFAPDDLPRLFDRFYRGKSANASGYGIGLALCKRIIAQQDATIVAKNHPQGGAVFILRFPK